MHGRYGEISLNGKGKKGIARKISQNFYELPISNLNLGNQILPWGGGAYFRLIPPIIFKFGVERKLFETNAFLLYLHPWELDPQQPKVSEASTFAKVRHYINISQTYSRLSKLVKQFSYCRFVCCSRYLTEQM
jgi:hypothetical protein